MLKNHPVIKKSLITLLGLIILVVAFLYRNGYTSKIIQSYLIKSNHPF